MSNNKLWFLGVNKGKLELILEDETVVIVAEKFDDAEARAMRKRLTGVERVTCSSSVDYPEEYGVAREVLSPWLDRVFGVPKW